MMTFKKLAKNCFPQELRSVFSVVGLSKQARHSLFKVGYYKGIQTETLSPYQTEKNINEVQ